MPMLQKLFDPGRWTSLQELFQQDLYRLHSLTSTSLLNIHLQVLVPPRPPLAPPQLHLLQLGDTTLHPQSA